MHIPLGALCHFVVMTPSLLLVIHWLVISLLFLRKLATSMLNSLLLFFRLHGIHVLCCNCRS